MVSPLRGRTGLVGVEIQMAQRTGGDHTVGAVTLGLGGMLADHREGIFFVYGEYRESAALALAGKFSDLGTQRFYQVLEAVFAPGVLRFRHYDLVWTPHVASVERRYLQAREGPLDLGLQLVDAVILKKNPEQVLDVDGAFIFEPLFRKILLVDLLAVCGDVLKRRLAAHRQSRRCKCCK